MATLLIVGSALFNLSLNGAFFFLSIILLKCKLSEPGVLWLFVAHEITPRSWEL